MTDDEWLEKTAEDVRLLEEGFKEMIDFEKLFHTYHFPRYIPFIIPVAVQDVDSKEVLMLAYADEEALSYSLENGVAAFWSTSRQELWVKGATSGNTLELLEVRVNCEQNLLLYLVRSTNGGACHTKTENGAYRKSCFYRAICEDAKSLRFTAGT
jgi:phosphoribosyl-AMP cyclohydrolase